MSPSLDVRAHLTTLYNEPHRYYHNLSHVLHCLRELRLLEDAETEDRPEDIKWLELEYAIWFHDAVYDPQAGFAQNEKDSASLAYSLLWEKGYQNVKSSVPIDVATLVEATRDHHPEKPITDGTTLVMIDIDMSILGQLNHVYLQYAKNIRKEYSWVPLGTYIDERTKILQKWQALPEIYYTKFFRKRYEAEARANIKTELVLLKQNWLTE